MLQLAKNYLDSKRRLSLHARLLNNMKEELDTRKVSATTVRNYITSLIMMTGGGNRPDAVNNMLVEEFQAGVHMEDKNCWIVSVHQHKTATSAGAAEVPIMGDDLKRLIELYIEHAMPFFKTPTLRPGSDEVIVPAVEPTDLLFPSKTDKQMDSLKLAVEFVINYILKPEFNYDTEQKLTPNSFRHAWCCWTRTPRLGRTSTRP
jgi:hypothetical protein